MTAFNLRRYVARETAIGIVVNALVSTMPGVMFANASIGATLRPVREVAIGATPHFFMAAFMSGLVPMLLICWKQAKGQSGVWRSTPRLRPGRAAVIAVGLAAMATILTLALIQLVIAPLAVGGMGTGAILALRGTQAVLAAAAVTPVAILLALGTARPSRPDAVMTDPIRR